MLLGEMMDGRSGRLLSREHDVLTVAGYGWRGIKNGGLSRAAEEELDVLLATGRNIPYRHNLSRFDLAVVTLRARTNSYEDLFPLRGTASTVPKSAPHSRVTLVQD